MITLGARTLLLLGIAGSGFAACSTQEKVNRTLDEVYKLAKNLNSAAEAAKAGFAQAPKSPGSAQSVTRGRAAAGLPAPSAQGQTATVSEDVDGDGQADQVTAFEDGSSGTVFYSAQFNACDDADNCEVVCVTWWEDGTALHSVAGYCDAEDFAYCVEEPGAEAVCMDCNSAGCGVEEPTEPPAEVPDAEVTAGSDDSCEFAFDGECDEPAGCAPGTDTTDCSAG